MTQKLGLTPAGRRILSRLRVVRDRDYLETLGLPAALAAEMLRHGLLEPQRATLQPAEYQETFAGWKSQRGMLIDHGRTLAFERAIAALVRPGDHVIDVGTGSGILAMMAARAGAGLVHGLELTGMADWAARLAAANGLDAVRIVQGDAAVFEAPRPADLLIGEFAGMYLLEEWRHHAAFVELRDRTLRPGGQVIPRAARMYLSAIDSRKLYLERGHGFWEAPVYGFDFSEVFRSESLAPQRYIVSADQTSIVATREIAAFDFRSGSGRDYLFETEVVFPYPAAGALHGFIGHFELDMAPGQVLSTGPEARETCWHQSYFPLPALQVPAGGAVTARVRSFLTEEEAMCIGITLLGPGGMDGSAGGAAAGSAGSPEYVFSLE